MIASDINIFVSSQESLWPKLIRVYPHLWIALNLCEVWYYTSAFLNVVAVNGAVFCSLMGFLNATMFSNLGVYFILDPPQLIIIVQNHLSAAESISSAVFLIAFSYPPKSIHLSQGIKSDTGISPNSSRKLLMDFNSWLSSATSSSPKSMAMERFIINLENHCPISTTTAPEVGSLLCDQ
nr:hypothetical protein Iba_chr13aCG5770 [Ipomoea batatas]